MPARAEGTHLNIHFHLGGLDRYPETLKSAHSKT